MVSDEIRRLITHEKLDLMVVKSMKFVRLIVKLTYSQECLEAHFTRGQTKVLSVVTLGQRVTKIIDNLTDEESRRMHHYNFRLIALAKLND